LVFTGASQRPALNFEFQCFASAPEFSDRVRRKSVLSMTKLFVLAARSAALVQARDGIAPTGKDGQPLNLGFEAGTLKDWTANGKAFDGQPIKGDTVSP